MQIYIHELNNWPKFTWKQERLADTLTAVRHRQGRLLGRMESLGFKLREEAVLQTLTEDVLKSSEIEGERPPAYPDFLSIKWRLWYGYFIALCL